MEEKKKAENREGRYGIGDDDDDDDDDDDGGDGTGDGNDGGEVGKPIRDWDEAARKWRRGRAGTWGASWGRFLRGRGADPTVGVCLGGVAGIVALAYVEDERRDERWGERWSERWGERWGERWS
jgi:hypothetical protein